jgi:hypothetical protein
MKKEVFMEEENKKNDFTNDNEILEIVEEYIQKVVPEEKK